VLALRHSKILLLLCLPQSFVLPFETLRNPRIGGHCISQIVVDKEVAARGPEVHSIGLENKRPK
jgi:hypothetical protein